MNYTIIKDLLPTYIQYQDSFSSGSFLVNGQETTEVPNGLGVDVSATVYNRWTWVKDDPISVSGNRLVITENSWGIDSFFDATATAANITVGLGSFPTVNLDSFSTSWTAEAKFSQWLFRNGPIFPYKPSDHCTFQTGLYAWFKPSNIIAKIYLQFNVDPSDDYAFKVMGDLFHLNDPLGTGVSYISPIPEATIASHPTDPTLIDYVSNFTFRLTGKNRVIDFEYSEDSTTWNTLYSFEDNAVLSPDFNNECDIGLYYSCDHRTFTDFPTYVYTLYEYMKVDSWSYTDVIDKCDDFYYVTANNNYFEYATSSGTSGSVSFTQLRQEGISYALAFFSTLVNTPILYNNNEYGLYSEVFLHNPLSGFGLVIYNDTTAVDFICISINYSKTLSVYKIVGSTITYLYSQSVSALDITDWVSIGAGYDLFDNTIIFWLNDNAEAVVRISDFAVTPQTKLGLLTNSNISVRNSSVIKVEDRLQRDLNEKDYSLICSDNINIEDMETNLDSLFDDFSIAVEDVGSKLAAGVVSAFSSASSSLDRALEAASITDDDLEPEISYEQALLNSGISIINGIPVIEGSDDIKGYAKLYNFFEDVEYIENLVATSTDFIFIVTKNKYSTALENGYCFTNYYNAEGFSQYPENNILCSPEGDSLTYPVEGEKIGETIIGINIKKSDITDSIMLSPDREEELNYYLLWIEAINTNFYMLNKLTIYGLNAQQLLKVDAIGEYPIEKINVYLLPTRFLERISNIWGSVDTNHIQDILLNPPEFNIDLVPDFDKIISILDNFRQRFPNKNLDYTQPDFEIPELEEGLLDPQVMCATLLEFLKKLQSKIDIAYNLTYTTISDPISYLSDTWQKILAVAALITNVTGKQGSVASTTTVVEQLFQQAISKIESIVTIFMDVMKNITTVFTSGIDLLSCITEIINLFNIDISDNTEEALSNIDFGLNSFVFCINEIVSNIVTIVGNIKKFIGLFNLLLKSLMDAFLNLKLSINGLNIDDLKNLFTKPSCQKLVDTVQKMLDSIKETEEENAEDEEGDNSGNVFTAINNNITVER